LLFGLTSYNGYNSTNFVRNHKDALNNMEIKIKQSLALKLSMYIITAVVIIFLAVLIYNYQVSKDLFIENNTENTKNLASSTLNKIDSILIAAQKVPEDFATVLEYFDPSKTQLLEMLKSAVETNPEIYGSAISFEPNMFKKGEYYFAPYFYKSDGTVQYTDLGNQKYDYFKWDWYTLPKKLNKGIWSEPYFDKNGGNALMVTYSQPFYRQINGKREFCGVVTCDIFLDWLVKLLSEIKIFKTGYAFILSGKGVFIAHPNKDYYTKGQSFFSLSELYNEPVERTIGENMISGKTGSIRYYSHTLKKNSFVYYQPLEMTKWSLGIVIPEDELFSKLDVITKELFIIGVIGYLLTLALIIFLSNKATIPLRSLAKATYQIGEGNFHAQLPAVKSSDEIGILNRSFHIMQDNLISYIQNLRETAEALKLTQEVTIECMASVAEFRDPETGMHIRRTQIYVKELALYLRNHPRFKDFLDDEAIEMLYLSAPLHDVGKVAIPDNILLKAGKLTDEEFAIMKKHPIYGRDAIAGAEKKLTKRSFLNFAKEIAASHHEKWDGSGYPLGLKGDDIPIPGRLMALADVYDALVTKRVYKPAFSHDKAAQIIKEGRGTHFDPDIVDAFLALQDKFSEIATLLADKTEPVIDQSINLNKPV